MEPFVAQPDGRRLLDLMRRETADPQRPPEMFATRFVEPIRAVPVEAITATAS